MKDSERKFLEASMKYLDISLNVSVGISEADLQQTLENAVSQRRKGSAVRIDTRSSSSAPRLARVGR